MRDNECFGQDFYENEKMNMLNESILLNNTNLDKYTKEITELYKSNTSDKTSSMIASVQIINYQNLILNLQNQINSIEIEKQQIIKNQIEAKYYLTDEGEFTFGFIEKEFLEYAKKLEIKRMKLELIEETVWNLLKEKVQSEGSIEEEPQWKSTKLDRITLLESAKEEAFHQYKTGKLSREDFIVKKCSIDVDIVMIENEVEEQEYEKLKVTDSLTREIVERYIDKVIVSHGGGIEVVLKV